MGRINRWSFEQKSARRIKIGEYMPCPICQKKDGLSIWEGERYLLCRFCGAQYQKKQKYIKPKTIKTDVANLQQTIPKRSSGKERVHTNSNVTRVVQFGTFDNRGRKAGQDQ